MGIEYWENGNKKYDDEWIDSQRSGKGIEYDEEGNVVELEEQQIE